MTLELQKKEQIIATFITVVALLYRNVGLMDDIKKALEKEKLISQLYGGLCIFLGDKSSTLRLEIKWSDSDFPNRFEFLRRFSYDFCYWENYEILYTAKIIAVVERHKFEELAFKDTTHLILLNMLSCQLDEKPTDKLIMRLLKDGNELQVNIGFYFVVRDIMQDMQDYEVFERNPTLSNVKTKRQINKNIKSHLEIFYNFYNYCSIEKQASLLLNYILSEKMYPNAFGYWLMEKELQHALIYEIEFSGKIKTLDHLIKVVLLVHDFPCRDKNGIIHKKNRLYDVILIVLKKFIINKRGIYLWDDKNEELFKSFCNKIPKKYLRKLNSFLRKNLNNYMVSELDELVRFHIYLEDKKMWNICYGMIQVLEGLGVN